MNRKQTVPSDWTPPYLHEVKVNGRTLRKGMLVSVHRRVGLIGGRWVFTYAECIDGILHLHVEGPLSREARHRVIRKADIKAIHRGRRL